MPKIVDHDTQKELIAKAAWQVIQNDGIENATVRKIAQQAGVSSGALRHYFSAQTQLLEFSMRMVVEKIERRFEKMNSSIEQITISTIIEVLLNFIPLDNERKLEMEVWLSLSVKALTEPSLKKISDETYSLMYNTMLSLLQGLENEHLLRKNLDLETEAKRLHALIDGLALHLMIYPAKFTKKEVNSILLKHLDELSN